MRFTQQVLRCSAIATILISLTLSGVCHSREAAPAGSIVNHRQYTTWELYKLYIVGGTAIMVLEALLIGLMWRGRVVRRRAEAQLRRRVELDTLIAKISASFVHVPPDQVDREIERAFKRLLEFLQLDRVALYQFCRESYLFHLQCEWASPGGSPTRVMGVQNSPRLVNQLSAGKPVIWTSPQELDLDPEFVEKVRDAGSMAIAVFPMLSEEKLFAVLAFTAMRRVEWPTRIVESLSTITDVFGNVLKRQLAEQALLASESLKSSILASLASQVAVLDRSGKIIAVNERWSEFNQSGADHMKRVMVGETFAAIFSRTMERLNCNTSAIEKGIHEVCEGVSDCFQTEVPFHFAGRVLWLMLSVARFKHEVGGAVVTLTDITERKLNEEAVRQLSGRLIHAQEEERSRIARELHDDINQDLALLGMELQELNATVPGSLPDVKSGLVAIWNKVHQTSKTVQHLSHQLHSSKLQHLGLIGALNGLIQEFSRQQTAKVDVQFLQVPPSLDSEISLSLFRVAQEALRNVVKHSHARCVKIELMGYERSVRLRISDDGVGFEEGTRSRSGLGLISMQERLRSVGGSISISTKQGLGTQVDARIPLPEKALSPRVAMTAA